MSNSWLGPHFPNLTSANSRKTSEATPIYNCIAWAANDHGRFWWPDNMDIGFWPSGVPRVATLDAFILAFRTLGFDICADGSLVAGS